MPTQRTIGFALAGTVAAGAIGALALTDRDADASFESKPSHVAISHEIDDADTPKELFEHADAVVVGQVTGSEVGRTLGDGHAEQMTDRLIVLKVTDVLKAPEVGNGLATGSSIKMVEGYWNGNKDGFVLDNVTWSEPGSKGVYFLHARKGEATYRLTNSYGRLLYGHSTDGKTQSGPSGVEPLESVWRSARSSVGSLAAATAFIAQVQR